MICDERLLAIMGPARNRCMQRTEVYARVCGFFRPVTEWNLGKKQEFGDRKVYKHE